MASLSFSFDRPAILLLLLLSLVPAGLGRPWVLFANNRDIRLLEISPPTQRRSHSKPLVVVEPLKDAASLDYVLRENRICWTELESRLISCSKIDKGKRGRVERDVVVSTDLMNPEGLACDWVNRKLYWTDSETKRIEVVDMERRAGREERLRKVLFWEDLDKPRAVALSPLDGLIFWSDWGVMPKIERASMDGDPASRVALVENNVRWPNGITLDLDERRLYWVEAKEGRQHISSVDWEGRERRRLPIAPDSLPQPFAVTFYNKELYWTDWTSNGIHRFNTSLSPKHPGILGFRHRLDPMDIKVFEPKRQPMPVEGAPPPPCSRGDNAGCSHICLAASNAAGFSCACPTGLRMLNNRTCAGSMDEVLLLATRYELRRISLDTPDFTDVLIEIDDYYDFDDVRAIAIEYDPVEGQVYWTDHFNGINRVDLAGGTMEEVVTDVEHVDGVAIDWLARNIYWTDTGTNRIEVSRLDGSARRVLVSGGGLDQPRGIELDPTRGWMYWSDWGKAAKIERAWMDGSHREIIVSEGLGWPNNLAVDAETNRVYWCDANKDVIESAAADGSDRRVLIDAVLPHPFGFTLLGDYIYWTDWQENTLQRARKDTGEDRTILAAHLENLMGVFASPTSPRPDWENACSRGDLNGGCSHLCLATPEGHRCTCPDGLHGGQVYELDADGETCVVPDAFLLYTREDAIGRMSLRPGAGEDSSAVLPVLGVREASALDFDRSDGRIYWSDIDAKTISRSHLNGTGAEAVVRHGLDFPDGLAVDWNAGNLYWTDMGLDRIEVCRTDGSSRRVLVWEDLVKPSSIAVNPADGVFYWSSWGEKPLIEQAALDGTHRKVFRDDVGRTNGLTIDFRTSRIYWTDLDRTDGVSISYSYLQPSLQATKAVIRSAPHPYGLTLFRNELYWADWKLGAVVRADKDTGAGEVVVRANVSRVMDILVYEDSLQIGSNDCKFGNGGCSDLCLFVRGEAKCACPSHFRLSEDGKRCLPPSDFVLFSQKNKISRVIGKVIVEEGGEHEESDEVPDLILPVQGTRDVQALSYDARRRLIYWVDQGSHWGRRSEETAAARFSIKRAFDNGTLLGRRLQGGPEREWFQPEDLEVDPVNRLLFWTNAGTGSIHITRLFDDEDKDSIGTIGGKSDKPEKLALHYHKSLIFWVNREPSARIERSLLDGSHRRTIVESEVEDLTCLAVDPAQDLLFWGDAKTKRIERSNLDGGNRVLLLEGEEEISHPVALAALGDHLYWADAGTNVVMRMKKLTGDSPEVVRSHVKHLSALVSVSSYPELASHPCLGNRCSHLCLVDKVTGGSRCSCPVGTGLVLNPDGESCGMPPTCKPDEFTCLAGSVDCIPLPFRCDGAKECDDFSDEIDCPYCPHDGQFLCGGKGDCVNATLLCDGKKDCEDGTDETTCCRKDQFRCAFSHECIDGRRTCDGVADCRDKTDEDELVAQCANADVAVHVPRREAPPGQSGGGGGSIATVLISVFFVVAIVIGCGAVGYCRVWRRKAPSKAEEEEADSGGRTNPDGITDESAQNGTLGRQRQQQFHHQQQQPFSHGHDHVLLGVHRLPEPPNVPPPDRHMVSQGDFVPEGPTAALEREGGSSNGVMYDRSHVTGASSSTSSSCFQQVAPLPSPTTTVRNGGGAMAGHGAVSTMPHQHHIRQNRQRGGRHIAAAAGHRGAHRHHHGGSHLSMHSLSRHNQMQERQLRQQQHQQPLPPSSYRQQHHHPPTPCSTDLNDESDVYIYGVGAGGGGSSVTGGAGPPARRHFTSAANSTYEDSDVGGGGGSTVYQESTPLYSRQRLQQSSLDGEGGAGESAAPGGPGLQAEESSPFFVNSASVLPEPPPPSRVPSPPLRSRAPAPPPNDEDGEEED